MTRKIAVCSQKGGVGKTTTAVNLAAALAKSDCRVLLVDNDSQCSATISCGFDKREMGLSLYDVLVDPAQSPCPAIRRCGSDPLWLLPGSPSLVSAEIELVKEMGREFILKSKMEEIEADYDVIIVDCTPGVSLLVLNALFFCDEVILPIQSQFLALEGMDQMLHALLIIRQRMRHPIELTGVLCTMFDRRTNLCAYILQNLATLFSANLFSSVIKINTKLAEAPLRGKHIFDHAPSSGGAEDYLNLSQEVIARGDCGWQDQYTRPKEMDNFRESIYIKEPEKDPFVRSITELKPLVDRMQGTKQPQIQPPKESPPSLAAPTPAAAGAGSTESVSRSETEALFG